MPLGRLIEYIQELTAVLGEDQAIHLLTVENGSTVPVFWIDQPATERVYRRADEVRRGIAPRHAMVSYRRLNKMLHEDRGRATLYEQGAAEIIPFPGGEDLPGSISGIHQRGTLDGELLKIGGAKEWVPVQIKTPEEIISGCYAKRGTAKEMGSHLFEQIRLHGRGRWTRTDAGDWLVDRFWIDSFELLNPEPLPEVVAALRAVRVAWRPNPVAGINLLEDEEE